MITMAITLPVGFPFPMGMSFLVPAVGLVEDAGFLPVVALAGNGGEKHPGGKEVGGFHARRI